MKNYHLIILLTALSGCINLLNAQNVYIPDPNFKAALVNNPAINTNSDTVIQVSEAAAYTGFLDVHNIVIYDLTGISSFVNIDSLDCHYCLLTILDLYANTFITYLNCSENQITYLNVATLTALSNLNCSSNSLTNLDLMSNTSLIYLNSGANMLSNLDITANISLKNLACGANSISSLNLSTNTLLTYLDFSNNQLTSVNLTANILIDSLFCQLNLLNNLDLSSNTALIYLDCGLNLLNNINLSSNTSLRTLICDYNQLTSINISSCLILEFLNCNENQLTNLNLNSNTILSILYCNNNLLGSLQLSTNLVLYLLDCSFNQLTSINTTINPFLQYLYCANNQLSSLNLKSGNSWWVMNFSAIGNPNLTCIQVDSVAYANSNVNWQKDSTATYSTNCNYPPTNCYAHFTMSPDTIPQTWYALNQCTGNGTINYVWSWGDGTPNDSNPNPSHTYATAGYYNICVSIADSAGCTNSYFDSSVYINKSIANTVINVSVVNQLPSYIITGVENPESSNFSIYPNPTTNTLNIQSTKNTSSNVKIYDAIGQLYIDEKLSNQNTALNLQHLQSGIYFIMVDDKVLKFVKE